MANIDKKEEIGELKKQLKQAQRKIEKLQSENESLKTKNKVLSTESKKKTAEIDSLVNDSRGKRTRRASVPRYRYEEIAIRFAVLLYAYAGISSHQVPKVMELSNLLWDGVADKIPSHVTVIDWVEKCGLSLTMGSLKKKSAKEAYSLVIDNSITMCGQDLHLELKASTIHPDHPQTHQDVSVARMIVGSHWNKMLSFVRAHASLVEELDEVMQGYEYMEQLCKQKGLSHKTASLCRDYVNRNFMTKGDRVRRLGDMINCYFYREESLLEGDEPHNICSDIIESTFGYFKDRMSPNKNNGYTPLVLLIPLHLKLSTIEDCRVFKAQIIRNAKLDDIKKWRVGNLLPNPSMKRMKLLKKVA